MKANDVVVYERTAARKRRLFAKPKTYGDSAIRFPICLRMMMNRRHIVFNNPTLFTYAEEHSPSSKTWEIPRRLSHESSSSKTWKIPSRLRHESSTV